MGFTEQDVLQYVEENDVKFIRLFFCDIFGVPKNVAVMAEALPRGVRTGGGLRCVGGGRVYERGGRGISSSSPDPGTLSILPWRPSTGRVARMFCDIRRSDGTPFSGCGRTLLRTARAQAKEAGLSFRFGTECEFYLFEMDEKGESDPASAGQGRIPRHRPSSTGAKTSGGRSAWPLRRWDCFPEGPITKKAPGQMKSGAVRWMCWPPPTI